ncbi:glycosyltransferase family 8 protein [Helicobacter pylori]|uniref:glycosyltransferase family 8 protein n=1 Tax=Helicobacter pylori TaxID=210 RepID=UPI0025776596|nr:glycosyltransferase family 8 protein [Helicobacter pylori]WJJ07679.1 glycosyltransferase family 8 protein [Helicobacter pylori]
MCYPPFQTIPIVVAFDNNYCIPAGVSLYSMLSCAKQERDEVKLFYQIHCLVDSLSAENTEKLKQTIAPFSTFSSIEFCDISKNDAYPFKLVSKLFLRLNSFVQKRFSKMILCRLLLASIFPQYEKIIMFDVDTLFVGDISESFFIPMDGEYFGMAKEDLSLFGLDSLDAFLKNRTIDCIKYFGLDEKNMLPTEELITLYRNHFNVGFMVANLKLWRDDNLEEKLCEFFVARNYSLVCPEQDTINIVCVNKILPISDSYNFSHRLFYRKKNNEKSDVRMVHFFSYEKPWNHSYFHLPYATKWHETLFKTSFALGFFENYKNQFENYKNQVEGISNNKRGFFEFLNTRLNKKLLIQYILFKIFKKLESFCLR